MDLLKEKGKKKVDISNEIIIKDDIKIIKATPSELISLKQKNSKHELRSKD